MSRRLTFAITLACASLLTACGEQAQEAETSRPVRTQVVAAQAGDAIASYSGEVRARRETTIGFLVSGRVQQRLVEVGDTVAVGTPLFRLDPTDAALNASASRSQLESARSQYEQARIDYQRYAQLAEKKYVSRFELEKSRLSLQTSQQSLQAAEANYRMAANQSAYTVLKATTAGVITAIDVEVGQVVQAGQAVVRVAEQGEREIVVSVPESRVDELRNARSLTIELWVDPSRRYQGRLREMAPDTDSVTRTYEAKVSLLDADASVRLGMTGKVHVASPSADGLRRIPLTAIYDMDGKPRVWVVDAGTSRVSMRDVRLAGMRKEGVLVSAGLKDGDIVVTAGVNLLHAGQKVRLPAASAHGEG
ncbi:efflux RND transporter periplasmic adaptor subunit [Arenimonas sp.]|uniref:efflux RND transporter periplasmic adaptor subunit n=1 Tax=Arenimonas sp. TaxID=1872635 RepID=UPI0039E3F9D3